MNFFCIISEKAARFNRNRVRRGGEGGIFYTFHKGRICIFRFTVVYLWTPKRLVRLRAGIRPRARGGASPERARPLRF